MSIYPLVSNILNSAFLVSKKVALVPNNFRNLEIQLILTNTLQNLKTNNLYTWEVV